jgi:hypothetical protein
MSTKAAKKSADFSIGQIVYILSHTGKSIIPAMIVEESTVKTLANQSVSWKLAIGASNNPDKPQKVEDSTNINGEIFSSIEEVKEVLITRLTGFLNKVVAEGEKRENAWYGTQKKKLAKANQQNKERKEGQSPAAPPGKVDPESFLDDYENQSSPEITVAAPVSQKDLSEEIQKENLQERLRRMATPEDEDVPGEVDENGIPVPVPDGGKEEGERISMGTIPGPNGTSIPINLKV